MTKTPRDFSKGLIYKLVCLDTDIKDIYVGSTTSFKHRKYQHKNSCYNEKSAGYNRNVYKFIRENGGWGNWDMILVESYPCKSSLDLHKREREIIEELKSTLNKNIPSRTNKEWYDDNKEYMKEHYEKNKEQTILCACGTIIHKNAEKSHVNSKKHLNGLHSHHLKDF